jgi:hypothetical protein
LVSDTLPVGLAYVPGSLTASLGQITDSDAPTLHWSAILSPMTAVTIRYAAQVTTTDAGRLVNRAQFLWAIRDGPGQGGPSRLYQLEAAIMVNSIRFHLPLVLKSPGG